MLITRRLKAKIEPKDMPPQLELITCRFSRGLKKAKNETVLLLYVFVLPAVVGVCDCLQLFVPWYLLLDKSPMVPVGNSINSYLGMCTG